MTGRYDGQRWVNTSSNCRNIGEGGTEAEIVAWHVKIGDTIREEDPLVDVMTDKATVEIPAPVTGTIVALNGAVGEKRPVGSETG